MTTIPLLLNLLAVVTGFVAVGEATRWEFSIKELFKGCKIGLVYMWVMGSTAFSLVHFVALLTHSPLVGNEHSSVVWLAMHSLIGLFFTTAHVFIDAVLEDKQRAHQFFGLPA